MLARGTSQAADEATPPPSQMGKRAKLARSAQPFFTIGTTGIVTLEQGALQQTWLTAIVSWSNGASHAAVLQFSDFKAATGRCLVSSDSHSCFKSAGWLNLQLVPRAQRPSKKAKQSPLRRLSFTSVSFNFRFRRLGSAPSFFKTGLGALIGFGTQISRVTERVCVRIPQCQAPAATHGISVGTHRQKQMQPEGGGTNVNIQSFCDETGGMGKQMHQIGMPPRFTFKRTNCSSLRIFFQGVHSQHFWWHCWFTACKYSSDGSTLSLNVTPGKSSRNLAFKHSRQTGRA